MYSIESVQQVQNLIPGDFISHATNPVNVTQGLPQASSFNLSLSQKPKYGAVLAYAQQGDINIFLYDVSELTIMLSIPQTMNVSFTPKENIKHSGAKKFQTIHGEKDGFLLYKNNQTHLDKIDQMFPNSGWRANLVEALPAVKVAADPVLMIKAVIYHNGENVPASLYEYSDKTLVVFAARDLAGDPKIMKWWSRYVCPDAPSGYSDGYGVFKNNQQAVNFLKQIFRFPELESRYVKSPAIQSAPVQTVRSNHFIQNKQVMFGPTNHLVDVVENGPFSVVVFFDPPINIQGFEQNLKNELNHPVKGKFPGYLISKSRKDMITWLETSFGLNNFESNYIIEEETSQRQSAVPVATTAAGTVQNSQHVSSAISNLSDIPIETLLRLLTEKIKQTTFFNKGTIDGKVIIFGENQTVEETAANLDDMATELEIKYGDRSLVMLK